MPVTLNIPGPPGNILAMDPAAHGVHVAVADEQQRILFGKSYDRKKHAERYSLARHETAVLVAQQVFEDVAHFRPVFLLAEDQAIRTNGRGKGDPNHLLPLAFMNGAVLTALQMALWQQCHYFAFARIVDTSWKGSQDADVFTQQVKDALSPGDKATLQHDNHNLYDACGLVRWGVERRNFLLKRAGS